MGKLKKSTKNFSAKGNLKASIAKRRVAKRKKQMTTDRAAKRKAERQIRAAAKSKTTGRSLKKTTAEPTTATTEEDDNDLAGLSVEDFMNEEFLQSSDDESEDEDRKIKGVGKASKASKASKTSKATKTTPNDDDDSSDGSGDEDEMDMELLKANDPEFAKFLAKNDPAAMEFNTDDLEQASSDDEEEPEDLKVTQSGRANNTANNLNTEVLTAAKLQSLVTSTFEDYSLGGLRNIVRAFAAATHMTDVDSTVASAYHYVITSSEVYNDLMMACVSNLHLTFNHHLPTKGTTNLPTTSPKWNQLAVIVKSFLKNLLHLMAGVTDTSMLLMLTTAISSYVPYIASISLLPKRYLRELLKHWSTTSKKDLRQSSFLAIRQMAIRTPFPFVEQCMKGCYLSFVRNAKTMNEQSRSAVAMMAKCIVELLGNDLVAAYQHAFVYIRQLAVHLRNAIKHKSKDAYATIFNWQYMNCLMVWAAVISTYPAENQLHALMYPLVQIIIGTVNLVPAARYFPMRFHCVGLLNKLSAATGGTLIPIPSLLLDVLRCPEFGKSSPSTRKPPQLEFLVKVSSKELQTKSYQEACVVKALELLENHFAIHKWSISYPELAHSTVAALRRFSRDSQVANWRQRCKAAMTRIQKQSLLVEDKRNSVNFGPKDLNSAKSFMMKEAKDAQQRYLLEQQTQQDKAAVEDQKNLGKFLGKQQQEAYEKKKAAKDAKKNGKKKGGKKNDEEEEDEVMGGMENEEEIYENEAGEDRVEDLVLSDSD